jgi:hypothetical protein
MNEMVIVFWLLIGVGVAAIVLAIQKHRRLKAAAARREAMMLQSLMIEQAKRQAEQQKHAASKTDET